ncbi:hypothetical protein, partial [Limnobaculum xujianqingii]|uniref:hypothetical protein n=1 Tax=Limnobaculum xujianqingii TaxID=2738837 RepID=UPI001C64330C
ALCPLPFALCPLPFALCPLPFALQVKASECCRRKTRGSTNRMDAVRGIATPGAALCRCVKPLG